MTVFLMGVRAQPGWVTNPAGLRCYLLSCVAKKATTNTDCNMQAALWLHMPSDAFRGELRSATILPHKAASSKHGHSPLVQDWPCIQHQYENALLPLYAKSSILGAVQNICQLSSPAGSV